MKATTPSRTALATALMALAMIGLERQLDKRGDMLQVMGSRLDTLLTPGSAMFLRTYLQPLLKGHGQADGAGKTGE